MGLAGQFLQKESALLKRTQCFVAIGVRCKIDLRCYLDVCFDVFPFGVIVYNLCQ